jgi:hypothetical protein
MQRPEHDGQIYTCKVWKVALSAEKVDKSKKSPLLGIKSSHCNTGNLNRKEQNIL